MLGGIGVPELVILTLAMSIYLVAFAWPAALILDRVGLSPWMAVLAVVPLANFLLLWYVALMPWPAEYRVGATIRPIPHE